MSAANGSTVARFDNVVDNYVKFRPTYPPQVFELLRSEGARPTHLVADIGAGTGIFTQLLLREGLLTIAIEPNDSMRQAAEAALANELASGQLTSLSTTSEATGLPDHSVDVIVAAQAFHWFNHKATREEFKRILKKREETGLKSQIFLLWNNFTSESAPTSELMRGYREALIKYGIDYLKVSHEWVSDKDSPVLPEFFAGGEMKRAYFMSKNNQHFDLEGLKGRCLSSSYVPKKGHPQHEPLMRELEALFEKHNTNGLVEFIYTTEVVYGHL